MSHTRPTQSTTQRHTIDLQVWVHRSALDTRWAKSFRGMKVTSNGDTSDGSFFSGLLQSINDDLARLAKIRVIQARKAISDGVKIAYETDRACMVRAGLDIIAHHVKEAGVEGITIQEWIPPSSLISKGSNALSKASQFLSKGGSSQVTLENTMRAYSEIRDSSNDLKEMHDRRMKVAGTPSDTSGGRYAIDYTPLSDLALLSELREKLEKVERLRNLQTNDASAWGRVLGTLRE